jgi:hypothetical protein
MKANEWRTSQRSYPAQKGSNCLLVTPQQFDEALEAYAGLRVTIASDKQTVQIALDRLIAIAQRDTGQSRRVANFLLAWWNASDNGGFDLTDMWSVDREIAADMVTIFAFVASRQVYANHFGYQKQMEAIWERWRKAD